MIGRRGPIVEGIGLALAAAAAFGSTTPLVQHFGRGADPVPIAALLYLGAAGFALLRRRGVGEVRLSAPWLPRVLAIGLSGAFVAPIALAAGLARTDGTAAALLLNLEAVFTVLLGAIVHREPVARRVALAVAALAAGGALVAVDHTPSDAASARTALGPLLVAAATLAWAVDNTLSRPLSDLDPGDVVAAKGGIGAALSVGLAFAFGATWPAPERALAVAACGAIGFGASLRLYLRAQRVLGSARTGSVFAVAPLVGVVAAVALGEPLGGWLTLAGGLAMGVGVWLHLGEQHEHEHTHGAFTHEHPHRHDDGHHDDHHHDPPAVGVHSHPHRHQLRVHTHPHGEDLHHRHEH